MIKGSKICGVSDEETLKYILDHPNSPKYIGFITNYKNSKRYVDLQKLKRLTQMHNNNSNFVSVLVDPDNDILEQIKNLQLDYYQLYDVSPTRTEFIKKKYNRKIITALTIEDEKDINKYKLFEKFSDIILFDGKGYEKSISFDHELLNNISTEIKIMIAGNITTDKIPILKNIDYIIDISGSLENDKGKKDLQKINNFLNKIKNYEN
tara:strand:+ start:127 stop:750 length:624 start_codon:yes stop_codon:yes gene_type:complete